MQVAAQQRGPAIGRRRDDEARPRGIEPFAQRGVIGAVEPRQPPLDIGTDIAGDEVAVASCAASSPSIAAAAARNAFAL